MERRIKVLGIAGSLRKESYNKKLLRSALEFKPENMDIEIFDLIGVPLYNGDMDNENVPEEVKIFKRKIAGSDGLLIATPEYNYSIPGVLKNAIDWASRPARDSVLNLKPLAIMGTTGGMFGTVRAQNHMRLIAQSANMMDMKRPELMIQRQQEKFSTDGSLTDEATKEHLKKFLAAFENWIKIFKKGD